jgi:hypothetical protein
MKPIARKLTAGAMVVGVAALFGLAVRPASAHHAFAAEYDANRPVKFEGTVTKMEWINPHAWIHVDRKMPDGTVQQWMIEFGTPNTLLRRGFTRDSLKPGTVIVIDGYGSKDGSLHANGRDVTLPDGRTLFAGSATPDAPYQDEIKKDTDNSK